MYLKSLTLKGFKSFADRTVMRFDPDLAAVVGPNGSGKSNISDAVLWVLGERNAKNLRGQYMEDVIFAGSSSRKPVSVAEVELCLDNSDGTLPVDFTEVAIGRRMYRNGESEYLVNGAVVRRMDVLDILHDSGLGTGTNSIISQGNLDSVLSSRPEDRRALIEEAAGVLKHKERKAKSERKLARMDANLTRIRDIAKEVQRQLGPLKRKADKAQVHAQLTQELEELSLALAVDDLRVLQAKWDQVKERDSALSQRAGELEESLRSVQSQLDQAQEELAQRSRVEGRASEALSRASSFVERFNSASMLLDEKKRRAQQDLESLGRTLEEARTGLARLESQEGRSAQSLKELADQRDASRASLGKLESQLVRSKTERSDLRKQVEASTARQRSATHRVELLQGRKEALGESIAEQRAQAKLLEAQLAEAKERLERADAQLAQLQGADEQARERLQALEQAESAAREELGQAMRDRDALRASVDAARDEYAQVSAERTALEELERAEERSNEMVAWALSPEGQQAAGGASLSPLTHFVSVDPDWDLAVQAYLAQRLTSLVVSDLDQARSLIASLAQAGVAGKATLAVRAMASAWLSDNGEAASGSSDGFDGAPALASVVTVDDAHRPVVHALLSGAHCADSIDQALDLASRATGACSFVTREGVVACADGVVEMLHLTPEQREQSVLARRRALEALRGKESAAKRAFQEMESDLAASEDRLRAAQSRSLTVSEEAAQARGQAESTAREHAHAQEEAQEARRTHDRCVERKAAHSAESIDAEAEIAQIERELAEQRALLDKERSELESFQDSLDPLQKSIVDLSNRVSDARLEAARLDERVAYEERMAAVRARDIDAARAQASHAATRIERARAVSRRIDPLIAQIATLGQHAAATLVALEQRSGAEQAFSRELSQTVAQKTALVRETREQLDALKAQHADLRVEKGRLEVQVESAVTVITQECGVSLETAEKTPPLADRAQAQESADRLTRRIKAIGAVSPDALQDYAQVLERHEYLTAQLDDMDKARQALTSIVAIIDDRMRRDFLDTFDQVNENFQEIFSTLFPGGSAYLSLEDPEAPETTGVEVNAHPVGKRVKKMSLLSGGEKSMTALALLFAVYRTRSTPFYILDEVEAALDDTNLRRLLAYLDTVRDTTQFIMITHQRRTMEQADVLYGVSMQSDGVTRVISQKLERNGAEPSVADPS